MEINIINRKLIETETEMNFKTETSLMISAVLQV